jgi:serine/threonine-protein kinase
MAERVLWGGRYAIDDELASGGMATVYIATRLVDSDEIPRVVALKKLKPEFAKQPEFVAMFLDEAHLAARVRHPNVVTTYEFLRTDEGLGIVMDLVVGKSLMQLVLGKNSIPGIPPIPVTLATIASALDGLHAAHLLADDGGKALNLVHRDVSPHNILLGADGVARVIDFGVAKAAGRLQTTSVGVVKGKFAYMSPEQIRGKPIDRRTDVFAAGIVLWETLTGRKLFTGDTNDEILRRRTSEAVTIPEPSSLNDDVPPTLDAIVLRALSTEPSDRFGSALSMAETLRAELEIASEATVAEWVKGRGGEGLVRLQATRERLEAATATTLAESERTGHRSSSIVVTSNPPGRLSQPPPPPRPLVIDVPDAPSPAPTKPPSPPVPRTPPVAPSSFELDLDGPVGRRLSASFEAPIPLQQEVVRPPRPSRAPRPVVEPSARRRGAWIAAGLVALLGGLALVVFVEGPTFLRSQVTAAAAARGLTLTFDRVDVANGGLVLRGAVLTFGAAARVRLSASEVDVGLDAFGAMTHASAPGFELTLSGSAHEILSEVRAWRARVATPLRAEGTAGHLVWSRAKSSAVRAEALDVALAASPDGALVLDSPGLLVNLPRAHLGPWRAHFDADPVVTRLRVSFDASGADGGPTAMYVDRRGEGSTDLFGLTTDLALEVSLHAHETAGSPDLAATAQIGLYGVPVASGHGAPVPVNVMLSGDVTGDPSKPLAIQSGKLTFGTVTSAVGGRALVSADGLRVEIDRPPLHGAASSPIVFDTRDWTADVAAKADQGQGPL